MATQMLHRRAPRLVRDPNTPTVPVGDSKREILYILIGVLVLALIALSFWFQATR